MRPRTLIAFGLAVAACAAAAPPAGAATVSLEFARYENEARGVRLTVYRLVYAPAPGESNRPVVSMQNYLGSTVHVADSGAPLVAGEGCRQEVDGVRCEPRGPLGVIRDAAIALAEGDDAAFVEKLNGTLAGGAGSDQLHTASGYWDVDGGPGADTMRTGGCCSTVQYKTRTAPVRVTPGALADDGEADEGDDVGGGFDTVIGGAGADELHVAKRSGSVAGGGGDDRIFGSEGRERLDAGPGDDSIDAGPGDDSMVGGPGGDVLRGREGSDLVTYRGSTPVFVALDHSGGDGASGEGDDVRDDVEHVTAGEGADELIGSAAANVLNGNGGGDRIEGGRGDDTIYGGFGANRLVGDAGDDEIRTAGPGRVDAVDRGHDRIYCFGNGTAALATDRVDEARGCAPLVTRAGPKRVRISRRGVVALRVRCPRSAPIPCRGRLGPYDRTTLRRMGTGDYGPIARGRTATVLVRLRPEARRRVVRRGYVSASVVVLARRASPRSHNNGSFPAILMGPR